MTCGSSVMGNLESVSAKKLILFSPDVVLPTHLVPTSGPHSHKKRWNLMSNVRNSRGSALANPGAGRSQSGTRTDAAVAGPTATGSRRDSACSPCTTRVLAVARDGGELAEHHVEGVATGHWQVLRPRQVAGLDGGSTRVQLLLHPPRVPIGTRFTTLGTTLVVVSAPSPPPPWPVLLIAATPVVATMVGRPVRR
jgi:hypothetical protein